MKLISTVQIIIYTVILVAGGILLYVFWGGRISLTQKTDLFKMSIQLDSSINDLLLAWGLEDSDIINEYRKEITAGEESWVIVNREIGIERSRVPDQYDEQLVSSVRAVKGEVYRKEMKGNRFIFESGSHKTVINRLIITFLRVQDTGAGYAAIVIDDVGYNKKIIEPFLTLGIPLTFAVLPQEQFSEELAELIYRSGCDVIVHMPMEPKDYPKTNPGAHSLFCRMSEQEIRDKFFENIYSLPYAIGINNHMGSRFMEDREKVTILMSCVSQSGLIFIDSRTTAQSLVPEIAKEWDVSLLVNDVFLDNEDTMQHIEQQLRLLAQRAKQMHTALGIGHVHKNNMPLAIKKSIRYFSSQGVELVTVSELMNLTKKTN